MTAEIAVLNKDAVALAADSTVTISGKKTYHTTNKLFALSKHHPVGVMIYGGGELAGIPWETLIKLYRSKLGAKSFRTLFEYKDNFLDFLESSVDEYSNDDELDMLLEYAEDYLEVLINEVDTQVDGIIEINGDLDDKEVNRILLAAIKRHDLYWKSKEKLEFYTKNIETKLKKDYSSEIKKLATEKLENHSVSEVLLNRIVSISINIFGAKFTEISGVVFSGFGDDDIFPRLSTCRIECIVNKKLKQRVDNLSIENKLDSGAAIIPFAQTDTVATFMEGISKKMHKCVVEGISHAIGEYSSEIEARFLEKKVSKKKIEEVLVSMDEVEDQIRDKLGEFLRANQYKYHVGPVVEAVQFLPKNEMAEVAESLVSITSFRQKISLEQESVGGAIDVAVISKSDGFVWIKRKHYFEPELNPMFFAKYLTERKGGIDHG